LLYNAIGAVSISTRCHFSNGRGVLLDGSLGLTGCLQMVVLVSGLLAGVTEALVPLAL
jgi:hypothetical protein